jgi:hypothetical protein
VVNNGRISANGGNAAPGTGTSTGSGGGGGGGGGNVCIGTLAYSGSAVQVLGGLGAAGYGTGTAGVAGNAGSVQVVVLS